MHDFLASIALAVSTPALAAQVAGPAALKCTAPASVPPGARAPGRSDQTTGPRRLAEKPAAAVQACKRLLKQPFRQQLEQAVKFENEEFAARVRSDEAKEVFTAFFAKRQTASQHA